MAKATINKDNIEEEKVVEVEENTVIGDKVNSDLKIEKEKNAKLASEVEGLKAMMEKVLESQKTQETTKSEILKQNKQTNSILEKYKNIDPNDRILIMNMVTAGGTYTTHEGHPVRFDYFGQIQPIKFRDLEGLKSKYPSYFTNLEIRILDDDVVDALYLRNDYNKKDISKEELEGIIDLEPQTMIEKIKSLSRSLQESAISLIIQKAAENDARYLDMNKWGVLNNFAGINIAESLENFTGSTKE